MTKLVKTGTHQQSAANSGISGSGRKPSKAPEEKRSPDASRRTSPKPQRPVTDQFVRSDNSSIGLNEHISSVRDTTGSVTITSPHDGSILEDNRDLKDTKDLIDQGIHAGGSSISDNLGGHGAGKLIGQAQQELERAGQIQSDINDTLKNGVGAGTMLAGGLVLGGLAVGAGLVIYDDIKKKEKKKDTDGDGVKDKDDAEPYNPAKSITAESEGGGDTLHYLSVREAAARQQETLQPQPVYEYSQYRFIG